MADTNDNIDFLNLIELAFQEIDVETERVEFSSDGDSGTLKVKVNDSRSFYLVFGKPKP